MKYHSGHFAARLEWAPISREGVFPPQTSKRQNSNLTRFQPLENGTDTWGNWKVLLYFFSHLNQFFMSSPDCVSRGRNSSVRVHGLKDGIKTLHSWMGSVWVFHEQGPSHTLRGRRVRGQPLTQGFSNLNFISSPAIDFLWNGVILYLLGVYFHTCHKGVTGSPHGGTERIKTQELRKVGPLIKVWLPKGLEDHNILQPALPDTQKCSGETKIQQREGVLIHKCKQKSPQR